MKFVKLDQFHLQCYGVIFSNTNKNHRLDFTCKHCSSLVLTAHNGSSCESNNSSCDKSNHCHRSSSLAISICLSWVLAGSVLLHCLFGAFACSGFGVWNSVPDTLSVFLLKSASKKCVFTNHTWTSTASESEFAHTNRILHLEGGALVYIQCQSYHNVKANYQSLSYSMGTSWIASLLWNRPWNRVRNPFVFRNARHREGITPLRLKLRQKPLRFSAAPIRLRDHFWNFLSASDWKHPNRPNIHGRRSNICSSHLASVTCHKKFQFI